MDTNDVPNREEVCCTIKQDDERGFLNEQRQRGMYLSKYLKQTSSIPPSLGFTLPCGRQSRPSGECCTTEEPEEPQCTAVIISGLCRRTNDRDWVKRKTVDGVHSAAPIPYGRSSWVQKEAPGRIRGIEAANHFKPSASGCGFYHLPPLSKETVA